MFSEGHRDCSEATSQVPGTARDHELEPVVAAARQDRTKLTKMLSEIYGWFTEGFDTKDLQEAKALLEELSH